MTELVGVPLPAGQAAERAARSSPTAPGVADTSAGLALSVGPVGLLLGQDDDSLATAWLLTGTVTGRR